MKYRQEPFLSFKKVLGFFPNNIEIYQLAVRHRSAPLKSKSGDLLNNERLEYLGDSVLNSIISDFLYHHFPEANEGFLTHVRANIVKRDSLNKICRQIGLSELIVVDKQINLNENSNILGNAFEAFVGAVYIDAGYKKCADFIRNKILSSKKLLQTFAEDNGNYKSELLEWCQQFHFTLDYRLIHEKVDRHNRHTFTSQVVIGDIPVCSGKGSTKKESQQHASSKALKMIKDKDVLIENLMSGAG